MVQCEKKKVFVLYQKVHKLVRDLGWINAFGQKGKIWFSQTVDVNQFLPHNKTPNLLKLRLARTELPTIHTWCFRLADWKCWPWRELHPPSACSPSWLRASTGSWTWFCPHPPSTVLHSPRSLSELSATLSCASSPLSPSSVSKDPDLSLKCRMHVQSRSSGLIASPPPCRRKNVHYLCASLKDGFNHGDVTT